MRIAFTFFGLFICAAVYSQPKEGEFYIFNQDWSTAKDLNSAAYFMHLVKENDTTYVCKYYNKTGPLVKWETYYDQDLSIPNGRFAWYNERGILDSMGFTYRGKKDRTWEYFFDDSSRAIIKKEYNKGKLLWQENHLSKTVQYANGSIRQLNEKGIVTSDSLTTDTTDTIQPAEYKGGMKAWTHYLSKELTPPDLRTTEFFQDNKAKVLLGFTVSEAGKISDIFIFQSAIWSFDMECIRVIRKGGDWIPAKKNGKPVEFSHKQSITFRGIRN